MAHSDGETAVNPNHRMQPAAHGRRKLALITGAAGLVGSRIVQRFLLEGMSVRALDQRPVDVAGV